MPFSCLVPLDEDAILRARAVTLRRADAADRDPLRLLFHELRAPLFAALGWPESVLAAFLDTQFLAQTRHYAMAFPDGDFLILEQAGQSVGRLSVASDAERVHIIDIAIAAGARGQGLGTAVLTAITRLAGATARQVSLQVESENPAQRLYQRLGFRFVAEQPPYRRMVWDANGSGGTSSAPISRPRCRDNESSQADGL